MNMPSILQKIRHFLSRIPARKASGHRHSKCRQVTRNKAGNGFSGAELPFGRPSDGHRRPKIPLKDALEKAGNGFSGTELPFRRPPDDHRRPEIPLKEALAMAREWQDEMRRWTETLKRQTP